MAKLGRKIGVKVNPYMLRKTFVSLLVEAGVPICEVAKLAGHSIHIAEKYYLGISASQLSSAVESLRI